LLELSTQSSSSFKMNCNLVLALRSDDGADVLLASGPSTGRRSWKYSGSGLMETSPDGMGEGVSRDSGGGRDP